MGRRFALLVGSSGYADQKLRRLKRPDADVAALRSVLQESVIGAFDDVQTSIDESAANVRRAVGKLFANKQADDLVLLFFAGHGIKDEYGHLHLATTDTDSELLNATALSADFVSGEMDRSRSRKQLLILDCCFSGAFSGGARTSDGVGSAQVFANEGVGRIILTATDSFQYAWEDETAISDSNSVFTHFLVHGLRTGKADTNGDGIITADEWYDYVYREVRAATPKQTPQRTVHAGAGTLVVAHNPRPSMPLPDDMVTAIRSPLPYVREGVVHELARLISGGHSGMAAAAREALQKMTEDVDDRVRDLAMRKLPQENPTPAPVVAAPPVVAPPPVAVVVPPPVVVTPPPAPSLPPPPVKVSAPPPAQSRPERAPQLSAGGSLLYYGSVIAAALLLFEGTLAMLLTLGANENDASTRFYSGFLAFAAATAILIVARRYRGGQLGNVAQAFVSTLVVGAIIFLGTCVALTARKTETAGTGTMVTGTMVTDTMSTDTSATGASTTDTSATSTSATTSTTGTMSTTTT